LKPETLALNPAGGKAQNGEGRLAATTDTMAGAKALHPKP